MIEQKLHKIGFGDKEVAIYLAIMRAGKISAADLSIQTKINRTTVYSVAKELIEKGVITTDFSSTTTYYEALQPEDLRVLIRKEERKIKEKKKGVESLIEELSDLPQSESYSVPKIRFIQENTFDEFIHNQLSIWIQSAQKYEEKGWWGFQDASLVEHYKDFMLHHWEIFPQDFAVYMITNDEKAETDFSQEVPKSRRNVKYWEDAHNFSATQMVIGDYVVFAVTKTHPHYLVEIHDRVIAENVRELFKGIWKKI